MERTRESPVKIYPIKAVLVANAFFIESPDHGSYNLYLTLYRLN
jgi:hypothetical protein